MRRLSPGDLRELSADRHGAILLPSHSGNTVEDYQRNNTVYHQASDRYYTIYNRAGRYYQRRHQIGPDGREKNIVEKEIHYCPGIGKSFSHLLHKSEGGQLQQLPIGWYSERRLLGYDPDMTADHMDFRRRSIGNAFSATTLTASRVRTGFRPARAHAPGAIPEGIDCQRCHGPGRRHINERGRRAASKTFDEPL